MSGTLEDMSGTLEELERRLEKWPSSQPFSNEAVFEEFPTLRDDSRARDLVLFEDYLRQLEQHGAVSPSEYLGDRRVSASLKRRLQNLADLHGQTSILGGTGDPSARFPEVGETVCGYTIIKLLGRGTFSRVYLATDDEVGYRRVAVKVTIETEGNVQCNLEANFLGLLCHPRIPTVLAHRFDRERKVSVLSMEFVGNRTLVHLIDELHGDGAGRKEGEAVPIAAGLIDQIATGLAYAHSMGVLHLDVKPANVLLRGEDDCVLVDFNLSATRITSSTLGFCGTLAYAAPEALESVIHDGLPSTPLSAASDTYSLGVVFYELLTGRLPWSHASGGAVEVSIQQALQGRQQILPPSHHNASVPRELDNLVLTALSWSPDQRFATGQEFHDALAVYFAPQRPKRWTDRSILALTTVIIATGILFGSAVGTNLDREPYDAQRNRYSHFPHTLEGHGNTKSHEDSENWYAYWKGVPEDQLIKILSVLQSTEIAADDATRFAATGYLEMILKDFDAAIGSFRRSNAAAIAIDADVHAAMGYCYQQLELPIGAAKSLDMALRSTPNNRTTVFLRAIVEVDLARVRDRSPNLKYIDQLLELNAARELIQTCILYAGDRITPNIYQQRADKLAFKGPLSSDNERLDFPGELPAEVHAVLRIAAEEADKAR